MGGRAVALVTAWLFGPGLAVAAVPQAGSYAGEFCVTVAQAEPACGRAEVRVGPKRQVQVRIADIVYRLQLHSSQLDVVLMHGTMQIDGFVAPYEWAGTALRFDDLDKRTRYELRLDEPRPK